MTFQWLDMLPQDHLWIAIFFFFPNFEAHTVLLMKFDQEICIKSVGASIGVVRERG
jgi:hypothetical protein